MESKNNWKAWLYLAPVLILLAVFTFYPIINTIYVSFLQGYNYKSGAYESFSLYNYLAVLTPYTDEGSYMFNQVMKDALPNTLLITFITVPLSIVFSLLIALGLNSIKILKKFFQTVFFMPYVTNAIAIGMVFAVVFDYDYGVFNAIFGLGKTGWVSTSDGSVSDILMDCLPFASISFGTHYHIRFLFSLVAYKILTLNTMMPLRLIVHQNGRLHLKLQFHCYHHKFFTC